MRCADPPDLERCPRHLPRFARARDAGGGLRPGGRRRRGGGARVFGPAGVRAPGGDLRARARGPAVRRRWTGSGSSLAAHFRAAGGDGRRTGVPDPRPPDRPSRCTWRTSSSHGIPTAPTACSSAAHYDTRPFPDRDPVDPQGTFLGANDGASGVALLMELGRGDAVAPRARRRRLRALRRRGICRSVPATPTSSAPPSSRGSTRPTRRRDACVTPTAAAWSSTWWPTGISRSGRSSTASTGPTRGRWSMRSGTSPARMERAAVRAAAEVRGRGRPRAAADDRPASPPATSSTSTIRSGTRPATRPRTARPSRSRRWGACCSQWLREQR